MAQHTEIALPDPDFKLVCVLPHSELEHDEDLAGDTWYMMSVTAEDRGLESNHIAVFEIATHLSGRKFRVPWIAYSCVDRKQRGSGYGRMCMRALTRLYGVMRSDADGVTSAAAQKAWKAIGGRRIPPRNPSWNDDKHVGRSKFIIGKHQVRERKIARIARFISALTGHL